MLGGVGKKIKQGFQKGVEVQDKKPGQHLVENVVMDTVLSLV